jgi:ubiquinone/menaquinone biosynthesis C-methylase UbiE
MVENGKTPRSNKLEAQGQAEYVETGAPNSMQFDTDKTRHLETVSSSAPRDAHKSASSIPQSSFPSDATLPDYAASLWAYHQFHAQTLASIIATLPVVTGSRVLDLATGDGTYAMLLAKHGARVTALDSDPRYLEFAAQRAMRQGADIEFSKGNAYNLPFDDHELDGAFCAQSFYDLQDAPRVLREMKRVVRPGGWVGVMENDSVHHFVLPWPAELELRIRAAQLEAFKQQGGDEERFYVARYLVPLFESVGLEQIKERSFSAQRRAPLGPEERYFFEHQLTELFALVSERMETSDRDRARALCTPGDPEFMLDDPNFSATILDFLVWARVPQ